MIRGFAGWGLFGLERWPHPRAARALELIVDLLATRAEEVEDGIRWRTQPALLTEFQRSVHPDGYYNLGLAHGIPVIWYLLAHVSDRGIRPVKASRLLHGSIEWVLSRRLKTEGPLSFPSVWSEKGIGRAALLAWCYGDLGIAAALWVAARCTGSRDWQSEAISIARNTKRLAIDEVRVSDTSLCHGAAGFAHVYNRFYNSTNDPTFGDAAGRWYEKTLAMRVPEGGIAGYAAWISDSV